MLSIRTSTSALHVTGALTARRRFIAAKMQPGAPGEGYYLGLGRVRIVFDEESHIDLWFEKDVLWGLSASGIKQEAHRIISDIVREEESLSAKAVAAESAAAIAGSRSGTQDHAGSMAGGPALPIANPVRPVEGRGGANEVLAAATRSNGSRVDTGEEWRASRGRRPRVLIRQCPPRRASSSAECEAPLCPEGGPPQPAYNLLAGRGESAPAGSGKGEGLPVVPGTETVVAYRARLWMSSILLHFRGKGLRRGAFLFLAVPEMQAAVASCRSSPSSSISSSSGSKGSDGGGDRGIRSGGAGSCEVDAAGAVEGAAAAAAAAAATRRTSFVEGRTELWVTDESVPLLPALSCQWAASTAGQAHYAGALAADTVAGGEQGSASCPRSSTDGLSSRRTAPAETVQSTRTGQAGSGESSEDQEVQRGEEHDRPAAPGTPSSAGACAGAGTGAAALLTMKVMPSARSPLPPLCCGVCGFSWETDGFGRRFRVYHIAVANNASLVWYLHKRFSEFLALHASLSGSGRGGGGEGIPRDRLPEPPKRTFGMLKLFPEKMEQFRRDQLETYLQELLSIPEALANRAVLSFLGLVSSSSYCVEPKDNGSRAAGGEGRRRGRGNAGESRPAMARIVADRSDRDSSDHGGPARGTHEGIAAEGAGERCRGGVNATATVAEKGQRPEGKEVAAAVGVARRVETVAALEQAARGGDVVLFRCRGLLSRLQRWVLRSEWDHVGVVVSGGPSGQLELLESSKGGVRLYPLVERVRAYHDQGFARRVAWRKLRCENPTEARARLEAFARQAEGKAYGIVLPFTPIGPKEASTRRHPIGEESNAHYVDIRRAQNDALPGVIGRVEEETDRSGQDVARADVDIDGEDATLRHPAATNEQPPSLPPPPPPPHPSYLCSQLVGAALSEMGVLRRGGRGGKAGDAGWLWVLPGAFGQGGAVERALAAGVSLGDEMLLDAHEPEVANAVLLGDSTVGTQC